MLRVRNPHVPESDVTFDTPFEVFSVLEEYAWAKSEPKIPELHIMVPGISEVSIDVIGALVFGIVEARAKAQYYSAAF